MIFTKEYKHIYILLSIMSIKTAMYNILYSIAGISSRILSLFSIQSDDIIISNIQTFLTPFYIDNEKGNAFIFIPIHTSLDEDSASPTVKGIKINENWWKNGLFIPFLHIGLYYFSGDFFMSTSIALKTYTINYFYWYEHRYNYLPRGYNWLKQFVRFSDSGHIASLIYYVYPDFLPVAFNIHFIITFGYWIGRLILNMKDMDCLQNKDIILWVETAFVSANHLLPILMLTYDVRNNDGSTQLFTWNDLKYSYYWSHSWILFVYFPWRMYTKDYVYDIFSPDTPIKKQMFFIGLIYLLTIIGNTTGYVLSSYTIIHR